MDSLVLVGATLLGTALSALLACVPGLHIYNVAGLLIILGARFQGTLRSDVLAMFMVGLVVGYAVLNTIPSVFLGAPDESTVFVVLPAQRYLMQKV